MLIYLLINDTTQHKSFKVVLLCPPRLASSPHRSARLRPTFKLSICQARKPVTAKTNQRNAQHLHIGQYVY